eukprot:gene4422-8803_t
MAPWLPAIYCVGTYLSVLSISRLQSGSFLLDTNNMITEEVKTDKNLSKLKSKANFIQLFLRCHEVPLDMIKDDFYEGRILKLGILSPAASFITHNLFGPGRWLGKRFSANRTGFNVFQVRSTNETVNSKEFDMKVLASAIDGKPTLTFVYGPKNRGDLVAWGMVDEVRALDKSCNILLGCGGIALSGGVKNFAPFPFPKAVVRHKNPKDVLTSRFASFHLILGRLFGYIQ